MIRVSWEIDVEAQTEVEAAMEALRIMQDPKNTAVVFEIHPGTKQKTMIDLEDYAIRENCPRIFKIPADSNLDNILNLRDRLDPGGDVPVCECPVCGSLAYLARTRLDSTSEQPRED